MRDAFRMVLNISFQGSVLILAVLFLRLVLRNAPKRYLCLLWLLVGLRLLVPLRLESELSLQPDVTQFAPVPVNTEIAPDYLQPPGEATQPMTGSNGAEEPEPTAVDWMEAASYIWIAAAAGMAVYGFISYLLLKIRMREAVKLADGVWESDRIETAFIMGYFRPGIYMPMGLSDAERAFMLDHEWIHLQRGDHWIRLAGFAALTVHWFNPLVWVAYALHCRDMEMACDERVVRNMGLEERKGYSAAMLSCSANRSHFLACPVGFGETDVKQRILAVLNYRKPRFWLCALALAAVAVTAVCFLTNPVEKIDPTALENWGITMTAEDSGPTGVTVAFDLPEKHDGSFIFNMSQWMVQAAADGEWLDVPMLPQKEPEIPWNGHVGMLFPNEDVQRIRLDWTTVYGELPPGWYRVQGTVMLVQEGMGYNKDFSAEFAIGSGCAPFAAMGEVGAWCNGISPDAVDNAHYYWEYTYRVDEKTSHCQSVGGKFEGNTLTDFLGLMNALPEEVFSEKEIRSRPTIADLRTSFPAERGLSVVVSDTANGLAVVLRYYNNGLKDVLELYMTENADTAEYLDPVLCWDVADESLLKFMKELMETLPAVHGVKS